MSSSNSSNEFQDEGNIKLHPSNKKKQISPAKHWVFTLNNYTKKDIIQIQNLDSSKVPIIVFQSEIGESGTKHLQGSISYATKGRPLSLGLTKRMWWQKKSKLSTLEQMRFYAVDPDKRDYEANILYMRGWEPKVKYVEHINEMFQWETDIIKQIDEYKPNRQINYIWEETGCAGKTTFQKWLFTHYDNCVVLSGGANDMKNGIVQYEKENNRLPKIVLINLPRSKIGMSWSGIEEIKDMFFFAVNMRGV